MKNIFYLFLVTAFLVGCSKSESEQHTKLEDSHKSEKLALEKKNPVGKYGKEISISELTKVSDILADPEKYKGKQVLISGTITEVCPKRGCWVNISSDKEFQEIQVKVKDGEIVFPLSSKGSEALIEGIVEKLELTKKQARNYLAHRAEEKGEEFDSTTVTKPLTIWRLRGLGAEIKT